MTVLVDVFSSLATAALVAMLLGPAPSVLRIYRNKSTGLTPLAPLVTMFANGWLWILYGYLTRNYYPIVACNAIAVALSALYVGVFYRFVTDRSYAHKLIGGFGLAVALATVYAVIGERGYTKQSRSQVAGVLGYLANATVFLFFAAPFENLSLVFNHRSGVFIPIQLVVVGVVNSAAWLTYGLLVLNWYIVAPNAGALIIGAVQVILYLVFHPKSHPYHPEPTRADAVTPTGHEASTPSRVSKKHQPANAIVFAPVVSALVPPQEATQPEGPPYQS